MPVTKHIWHCCEETSTEIPHNNSWEQGFDQIYRKAELKHVRAKQSKYRNQILAKFLFSSSKMNNLPVYFQAAAFSGNGKVGGCLGKILSFHPFGTGCILMKKPHSLSPQLLFAFFFSLESTICSSWFFCSLLPPSLLDFQMFQHRPRQALSPWGVHRNAAINS